MTEEDPTNDVESHRDTGFLNRKEVLGRARLGRRGFLATAGAIGVTSLSGCVNPLSAGPTEFTGALALLPLSPLKERRGNLMWRELNPLHHVVDTGELSVADVTEKVKANIIGSTYQMVASRELTEQLGDAVPGGEKPVIGETMLFGVPKIKVAGQTIDIVGKVSGEEILGHLSNSGNRPTEEGPLSRRFELNDVENGGLADAATYLQHAYNGKLAGVEDVESMEWGSQRLESDQPLVFEARGETRDGDRGPIIGSIERLEYDEGYVYKAGWTPVEESFGRQLRETGGRIGDRRIFKSANLKRGEVVKSSNGWTVGPSISVCVFGKEKWEDYQNTGCRPGFTEQECRFYWLTQSTNLSWQEAHEKCSSILFWHELQPPDPGTYTLHTPSGNGCATNPPYCYVEDQIYL